MGFDKLSKEKEQSVVTAIEKIIDTSRHSKGTDLNKIAADVLNENPDMTPALARRACEAYNKSKSVYTLQKRAAEDRAETFDLIDPDEVNRLMYGYHQKAASDLQLPARSHKDNIPELRRKLEKVALDASESPEPLADVGVIEREIHRTSIRLGRSIDKLRETVGMRKQASEDALHRACQVMRRMAKKPLHKVARMAVNRYGADGVRLMKLIGAYIEQELPLEKTAAAAIFPLREPYTSIAIAIDEARAYCKYNGMLEKTAAVLPPEATDPRTASTAAASTVDKARRGIKALLDPALDFAKSPIYGQLTKETKKKDDEAFDATLRNQLQQLRATQAFVDIASDDFIKDYPIDDAVEAYNNVVGTMPELLDEKYTPWLKALVREQLVQGNVYDSNTIKELQSIGKEIKKGRVQSIDEVKEQLKAGEGGKLEGLGIQQRMSTPEERPRQETEPTAHQKAMEPIALERAQLGLEEARRTARTTP